MGVIGDQDLLACKTKVHVRLSDRRLRKPTGRTNPEIGPRLAPEASDHHSYHVDRIIAVSIARVVSRSSR
jgi:hypothetical protein